MKKIIPENLTKLADVCQHSLYIVGGSVRDFLCGFSLGANTDWDISSPMSEDEFILHAKDCGFQVQSVYRNTGTVKLTDGQGVGYEFTRFRSDKYVRGEHKPSEITFTQDIALDARRRDFCANAVYYDIKAGTFVDPLGGIEDIKAHKLRTVAEAEKVFGEDGLRLMRLARFAAQLGFTPDEACLAGAKKNAELICDIVPERIFKELSLLLASDKKHGFVEAPYRGLTVLKQTDVLKQILPELALGDGLSQRADFHKYDVLEHSLRCVLYAPERIRFAALLHDVGKPFCHFRDGNVHEHPKEGARIAEEILTRLKAPKALIKHTVLLVKNHMRDYNLQMRENKVRREILECYGFLEDLYALKQADFSACKDDLSPAPCVIKWEKICKEMKAEHVPFTIKALAVNGVELQRAGVKEKDTSAVLKELLLFCAADGRRNTKKTLLKYVTSNYIR